MGVTMVLISALIALITYVVYKIHEHFTYFKKRGIPYDPPSPLLGNMSGLRSSRTFSEIWYDYYFKFKGAAPFAGFYFMQKLSVYILDIDLIKHILIKDFANFTDRGFYSNEKDDPLTGQLFLLDGQRWRSMRNKLSPVFTSGKMKNMFSLVIEVAHKFQHAFDEAVKENPIVEVKDFLARFTTDVIGTCAFGIDCNSLKDPNTEFRIMSQKSLTEVRHNTLVIGFTNSFPEISRWLGIKQTPEHIEEFYMRIVRENVEYREKNGVRRNDFMDMLIDLKNNKLIKSEDGQELTNLTLAQITAQAFVFFQAGFETSSTTMGYVLYELAQHHEVQEKARAEIKAVLEKHQQQWTYESLKELQYLDQIISETLRLYTIVPVLNRQALVDYVVPGRPEYVIEKGMSIIIPAEAIHRDPEFYPNPDVFDPDRFAPEQVKQRDSVLWMPFGDGPRNCVGMRFGQLQTRMGLAILLEKFKFSVCEKTQIPLVYNVESFLKVPKDGVYLKVEKVC